MADAADKRLSNAIGVAVSEFCLSKWGRRHYLQAVECFWKENSTEPWELPLFLNTVKSNDPHLKTVGQFLHAKALLNWDPHRPWQSQFPREAKSPIIVTRHGIQIPVSLSDTDLRFVEQKGKCLLAIWDRAKLLEEVTKGTISRDEAAAQAETNGLAPIPTKLADVCHLPNQPWLYLNEVVVALIVGKPGRHTIPDARLTKEFIDLACEALLDAACNDQVHLFGRRGDEGEVTRIGYTLFRNRPNAIWRADRLVFYRPHNPDFLVRRREEPVVWHDVHVKVSTLKEWCDQRGTSKVGFDTGEQGDTHAGRGRRDGSVKDERVVKVVAVLLEWFRADPQLCKLPGSRIAEAAKRAGVSMPSTAKTLATFERSVRHHLNKHADIQPRITSKKNST